VAFGEEDDGIAGDVERLERLLFVVGLGIVQEIEPHRGRRRCPFEIEQTRE
jgi:hypothetical protein